MTNSECSVETPEKRIGEPVLLSVIVPVFNEAAFIDCVLDRLAAMRSNWGAMEIVAVDDGSTDGTSEILERRAQGEGLTLVRLPQNRGKGRAVRTGLEAAKGTYVLVQDADMEYDPCEIPRLMDSAMSHSADIVLGSRFLAPEIVRVHYFLHKQGNRLITLVFNLLNNTTFTDIYCGMLLFRRTLIDPNELKLDGWAQQAEILSLLVRRARAIYEAPVNYHGRSYDEGKKIRGHHIFAVLAAIIAGRFRAAGRAKPNQRPQDEWLDAMENADAYRTLIEEKVAPHLKGRLLEIGCGSGNFAAALAAKGHAVTAIERDPNFAATARERLAGFPNCQAIECDVRHYRPDARFDTILMLDVLEHIESDREILIRIRDWLAPDGRLVIKVPAHPALYGSMDEAVGHYRRYTRQSLADALEASGYRRSAFEFMGLLAAPGWWLNGRVFNRSGPPKGQVALFDFLLPAIKWVDALKIPAGLALIAVAQPEADAKSRETAPDAPDACDPDASDMAAGHVRAGGRPRRAASRC